MLESIENSIASTTHMLILLFQTSWLYQSRFFL